MWKVTCKRELHHSALLFIILHLLLFFQGSDLDLESEMELQDDVVAKIAFELHNVPFVRAHLPALTDKSFYSEVSKRSLLIVLFYLDCKCSQIILFLETVCSAINCKFIDFSCVEEIL